MARRIKALLDGNDFDLIHCDSLQMSRNILRFKTIPRVLTEHNIESQILERAAGSESNPLKRAYFYLQYLKLKRYEVFACKRFDRVVAVSENDKTFLERFISSEKIFVVPNGVDTGYFMPSWPNTENRTPIPDTRLPNS